MKNAINSFFLALIRFSIKREGEGEKETYIYYQNGKKSKERACLEHLYYENSIHVPKHGWILEYLGQSSQFLV